MHSDRSRTTPSPGSSSRTSPRSSRDGGAAARTCRGDGRAVRGRRSDPRRRDRGTRVHPGRGSGERTLGAGFVPARKPGKLPWERVQRGVRAGVRDRRPGVPPRRAGAAGAGCWWWTTFWPPAAPREAAGRLAAEARERGAGLELPAGDRRFLNGREVASAAPPARVRGGGSQRVRESGCPGTGQ